MFLHILLLLGYVTKATLEESQQWPKTSFSKWMDSQILTGVGVERMMTFASGETETSEWYLRTLVSLFIPGGYMVYVHSFIHSFLCRVGLQNMKILRPPPDIARYTMVFHQRDSGNEVNRDRLVHVDLGIMCRACFIIGQLNVCILIHAANLISWINVFFNIFFFASQDEVVGKNTTDMEKGWTQ